jgi:hypothetical protein
VAGPRVVRVTSGEALRRALDGIGALPRPVVVLVGGASGMSDEAVDALAAVLREAVLPVADAVGAVIVDGATDAGVMRAVGVARSVTGRPVPLVGVAAEGTVARACGGTGTGEDAARLEPNHTLAVLVPGSEWGDEVRWMHAAAAAIAGRSPSVTILVNGGEIAFRDVAASLDAGRPVLVLAGSGRTADAVAAAAAGDVTDPRAVTIARSPLTTVLPAATATVRAELERLLDPR